MVEFQHVGSFPLPTTLMVEVLLADVYPLHIFDTAEFCHSSLHPFPVISWSVKMDNVSFSSTSTERIGRPEAHLVQQPALGTHLTDHQGSKLATHLPSCSPSTGILIWAAPF